MNQASLSTRGFSLSVAVFPAFLLNDLKVASKSGWKSYPSCWAIAQAHGLPRGSQGTFLSTELVSLHPIRSLDLLVQSSCFSWLYETQSKQVLLLTEIHYVGLWTTWPPSWDAFLNCFALVRKNVEAASPKSQALPFRLTTQGTYFLEAWVADDYWCPRGKLCPEKTTAYPGITMTSTSFCLSLSFSINVVLAIGVLKIFDTSILVVSYLFV